MIPFWHNYETIFFGFLIHFSIELEAFNIFKNGTPYSKKILLDTFAKFFALRTWWLSRVGA